MSAGKRLIDAAKDAVAIAKGEQPAAVIHHNGHSYVPKAEFDAKLWHWQNRATKAEAELSELRRQVEAGIQEEQRLMTRLGIETRAKEAAEARVSALEAALRDARVLVEKWCHYQGNTKSLFDQYLGPIDRALASPSNGEAGNAR